MVDSGADLLDEMEDTSLLTMAIENGDASMVKVLLDLGHAPDLGGIAVPLAEASHQGNIAIVELLLTRGAKVDAQGDEGETALMWAAAGGQVDIVKRLIAAGAKILQKD